MNDLENHLREWKYLYNWYRPHSSLSGLSLMDKYFQVSKKTPFWNEVMANYDTKKEQLQETNANKTVETIFVNHTHNYLDCYRKRSSAKIP